MIRLTLIFTIFTVGFIYTFYSFSEYKSSLLSLSRSFLSNPHYDSDPLPRLITSDESWPALDVREQPFLDYRVLVGGVPRMLHKRQTTCPTGTSACGTDGACCQEDENCWVVTSTCAKKGTCPGSHPVLCRNQTADPSGQDASKFFCCTPGLVCLNDRCEEPQPTETPEPFTITMNRISFVNGATPTPSNSKSLEAEATSTSSATATPSRKGADPDKGRNQTTAIVGGVLGGALATFALVGLLLFWRSRRKGGAQVPYIPPSGGSNGTSYTYASQNKAALPGQSSGYPHSPGYPSYDNNGGHTSQAGEGGAGGNLNDPAAPIEGAERPQSFTPSNFPPDGRYGL